MALKDTYGRTVTNLRISLISECNLRCIYCHAEGEVNPKEQMSTEEIAELMQVAAKFGIRSIKFTGGEPMLRPDLLDIIRAVPPGIESSMTTNGTLLAGKAAALKEAGLSRVNVSLDTLRPDRYREITGRDQLDRVLAGIRAAIDAGLTPVKLNMVLLEGINDDEFDDFMEFVRGNRNLILQVIELMDFHGCKFHGDVDGVERDLNTRAEQIVTRRMHHRKKYCLDDAEVEVVRPLHNTEFCEFCNRLRVTSDGKLKPCLLRSDNLIPIRGKHGEDLEAAFREAVSIREPFFR
ncbi:molybdenum cofactor biosynthesis protein MoeA [Methanoculleus taiwanensis]|uniref:Probable GTP 3',8-cyclase n=1 Tax=Methanoculleus taiwanensis TaxID=1550565 RepID=A0A498GZ52_9EURY|nr:GTP 3',8-cyclase MoaA [Methanoculleus taiwanensis]RXE55417.1 molybdenum cofactor biosynthesis protein MoeA [Methanoculleus taiwanensis]